MLSHYLPPLNPKRDGSHIAPLWSRALDQHYYFPFYERTVATRLPQRPVDLYALTRTVLGFMEAGDHYRDAYHAAINFQTAEACENLQVPFVLMCADDDLLLSHMERLSQPGILVPAGQIGEKAAQVTKFVQCDCGEGGERYDGNKLQLAASPFFRNVSGNNLFGDWLLDENGTLIEVFHRPGFGHSMLGSWPPAQQEDACLINSSSDEAASAQDAEFWRILLDAGFAIGCSEDIPNDRHNMVEIMRPTPGGGHILESWFMAREVIEQRSSMVKDHAHLLTYVQRLAVLLVRSTAKVKHTETQTTKPNEHSRH